MTNYDFFTAQLRFIAKKTEREPGAVDDTMRALEHVISDLEIHANSFDVKANDLGVTARALAGVAGFLQQHILPEAVEAGHSVGEEQIRWTIETCMSTMAKLMSHAELNKDQKDIKIKLPAYPSKPVS